MRAVKCAVCHAAQTVVLFELQKGSNTPWFLINECQNCGHVYMNPQPTTKELGQYYSQDYYYDDFYSEFFNKQSLKFYQEIRSLLKPHSRILDVGCSKGYFLNFAKLAGHKVAGIEMSRKAATYAKKHFAIKVQVGSVEEAKIKNHSQDVVTAFDLIEHLPNPQAFLKKVYGWLDKEGKLIIDTPNFNSLYRKIARDRWNCFDMPYHINLFRPATIETLLRQVGFQEVKITTSHFNLLSREGWVRSKGFGSLVLLVKLLRMLGLWEQAKQNFWVQPVAHVNHFPPQKVGKDSHQFPKVTAIDLIEAGVNTPLNWYFANHLLWGDGLRVVAVK